MSNDFLTMYSMYRLTTGANCTLSIENIHRLQFSSKDPKRSTWPGLHSFCLIRLSSCCCHYSLAHGHHTWRYLCVFFEPCSQSPKSVLLTISLSAAPTAVLDEVDAIVIHTFCVFPGIASNSLPSFFFVIVSLLFITSACIS